MTTPSVRSFSCLWSKDAQQKKRKRWTDGVLQWDTSKGILAVWTQDKTVKVFSTRLKPDEVSSALMEDEETRFGGVSLQTGTEIGPLPIESHTGGSTRFAGKEHVPLESRSFGQEILHRTSRPRVGPTIQPGMPCRTTKGRLYCPLSTLPRNTSEVEVEKTPTADMVSGAGNMTGVKRAVVGSLGLKRSSFRPVVPKISGAALVPSLPNVTSSTQLTKGNFSAGGICSISSTIVSSVDSTRSRSMTEGESRCIRGDKGLGGGRTGKFNIPKPSFSKSDGGMSSSGVKQEKSSGQSRVNDMSRSLPIPHQVLPSKVRKVQAEDTVQEWTKGEQLEPLMLESSLARKLHPHQREGVRMLWQCLSGRGGYPGHGAILADEMGLGKTVIAIALCNSVLRLCLGETKKAVVVCPSSLVRNWANEFRKWSPLGGRAVPVEQAGVVAAQLVDDFRIGSPMRYPVLIISYELYSIRIPPDLMCSKTPTVSSEGAILNPYLLHRNHGTIINATKGLGLLVADEGHRLKNSVGNKTTRALKACPAKMRLLLTGTPMQNDLDEFFSMADFVNPGILGDIKSFRSRFSKPIKAAWDRDAEDEEVELAGERTRELGELSGKFVLRRTKGILSRSLPAALEVVIFCCPSPRQLSLYERCLTSPRARALLDSKDTGGGSEGVRFVGVLPLISTLRKICNHPDLLRPRAGLCSSVARDRVGADLGAVDEMWKDWEEESEEEGCWDENWEEEVGDGNADEGQSCHQGQVGDEGSGGRDEVHVCTNDRKAPGHTQERLESSSPLLFTRRYGMTPGKENISKAVGLGRRRFSAPSRLFGMACEGSSSLKKHRATKGTRVGARAGGLPKKVPAPPPGYKTLDSGKLEVLEGLLEAVQKGSPDDKVVLSSNFTSTLNVLECMANRRGWGFLRLDGGTTTQLRQSLVDRFNRADPKDLFLFLLSAKAGGVGLNLVGANRVVLFDSDWNPATDDQTMARVWRIGQVKEVTFYRLLSTGTLEESIYQRQIVKGALYNVIQKGKGTDREGVLENQVCQNPGSSKGRVLVKGKEGPEVISPLIQSDDGGDNKLNLVATCTEGIRGAGVDTRIRGERAGRGVGTFSREELKELFVLKQDTRCDTFDKLCCGQDRRVELDGASPVQNSPSSSPGRGADLGDGDTIMVRGRGKGGWKDYTGPAGVEGALREALQGPRGERLQELVTFVREIKRGVEEEEESLGEGGIASTPVAE